MFAVKTEMPDVPTTMMAFVAEAPAPSPPPPPPPPAPRTPKVAQATTQPAPHPGPTFAVPATIPVGIQPETGIGLRDEGGVVGGVEGGIPGGVLGGILREMIAEPPPPPPPVRPMRVGGDIKSPALLHRVEPDYPGVAVSAKITGLVILEATVDETGAVIDVKVLRSIHLLDSAAMKAVKQWRYEPLLLNGTPAPFILTVVLTFSLR
jgi:protein TonB